MSKGFIGRWGRRAVYGIAAVSTAGFAYERLAVAPQWQDYAAYLVKQNNALHGQNDDLARAGILMTAAALTERAANRVLVQTVEADQRVMLKALGVMDEMRQAMLKASKITGEKIECDGSGEKPASYAVRDVLLYGAVRRDFLAAKNCRRAPDGVTPN